MKARLTFILAPSLMVALAVLMTSNPALADDPTTCDDADCHEGIEDIRDPASGMFLTINALGGCTVCHGGDGTATAEETAHGGTFYPDPGSIWIADNTCGQDACHPGYPYIMERALMNTEAGKIQGNTWSWGIPDSYAADGAQPTIEQALLMIAQFLQERAVSGTTVTVKKPDGSTTAMTFTLDDSTDPTEITRAS